MQSRMILKEFRQTLDGVLVSKVTNGKTSASEQELNRPRKRLTRLFRIARSPIMAKRVLRRVSFSTLTLLAFIAAAPTVFASGGTGEAAGSYVVALAEKGFNQDPINGPDSVTTQLKNDSEEKADLLDLHLMEKWNGWKADIKEERGGPEKLNSRLSGNPVTLESPPGRYSGSVSCQRTGTEIKGCNE